MMRCLRAIMLVLVAVGVSYGISSLLGINRFAWILLKGKYYHYISIYLPRLAIWCSVCFFVSLKGVKGLIRASIVGSLGGYVCGLMTFILLPIYGRDAIQRIFTTRDFDLILFLSPIISLSWLTGMITAWVIWGILATRTLNEAKHG
jgi:hypothetical protein